MFSFLTKKQSHQARINDQIVTVQPRQTLLQAALDQGIAFPHSCRVGGCATCKCRLVSGKVKELTETGYILSDDDLDRGCILACQSVPLSDVVVEVDLSQPAARRVTGRVVGQERLTHDITRLQVRLDETLPFKPGQFAQLTLSSLPQAGRSYSFATADGSSGQVDFFVRLVPGGVFSTAVHERDLLGEVVTVEGPQGDFWLRPGDAPLLMMAGGSGLAPILAMLEAEAASGANRPVTLLFGARQQRDLYALERISRVEQAWSGPFRFIPVLSEADGDAAWRGERGLVTESLQRHLPNVSPAHAYLCGPPGMVDAATSLLRAQGLAAEHIHADRFITQADRAPVPA